jgi:hypothetical protein
MNLYSIFKCDIEIDVKGCEFHYYSIINRNMKKYKKIKKIQFIIPEFYLGAEFSLRINETIDSNLRFVQIIENNVLLKNAFFFPIDKRKYDINILLYTSFLYL